MHLSSYKTFLIVLFLQVLLLKLPCSGENNEILSWQKIKSLAENHPELLAAKNKIEIAELGIKEVSRYPNPELSARFGDALIKNSNTMGFLFDTDLTMPFELPEKRARKKEGAEKELRLSEIEYTAAKKELLLDLRVLYLNLMYLDASLKLQTEAFDRIKELAGLIELKVQKGITRQEELVRLQTEADKIELSLQKIKNQLIISKKKLIYKLSLEKNSDFSLPGELENILPLSPPQGLNDQLLSGNTDIQTAKERIKLAEITITAEKLAKYPDLNTGLYYERDLESNNFGLSLSLEIPLFKTSDLNVRKAGLEKKILETRLSYDILKLEYEIREAYETLVQNLSIVNKYRASIIPKAENSVKITEQLYQSGETALMDLLDVKRNLINTKIEYLESLLEYHQEKSRYQYLTGLDYE